MTSPRRQQQLAGLETATVRMSISPQTTPIDWKARYETLKFEHQLELERIRLHYEHQLKEKVAEVRAKLRHEYEVQCAEYRARTLDQQHQQLHNISSSSLGLDQSLGEQVREQLRLAQEYDRREDEHRQLMLQQSTDSTELKRLVNKLHTEGVHVLTLSELLALRLNGINIGTTEDSIRSLQALDEENSSLRTLIAHINAKEPSNRLVRCLADIFRCEQERRLIQIRQHPNASQLEREIRDMCDYQRDALAKFLSEDRVVLMDELEQTKGQLNLLRTKFDQLKQTQNQSTSNRFYYKYIRAENHRKALVYQKRYLLVLLTGYEDTESYALNEIRRLTGDSRINSHPYSSVYSSYYEKMQFNRRQPFNKRLVDYRFRFRCYAQVVIASIRIRRLAKKWAQKLVEIK